MHSELFRIPYEVGGVPLFGVGLLLVLWAGACAVLLASLVRRHGWGPETWSYLLPLVVLGAAIVLLPRLFPDGLPIRGYGVMLLAGSVAGIGLAFYRARQIGLEGDLIISLALAMFLVGILGARLFYVVQYWNVEFAGKAPRDTIVKILQFTEGGLVVYGALAGAAVAFVWFVRRHKLPLLAMADLVAPSLAVGLALGRVGCFLNGCCYGGPTDLPWAVTFPKFNSPYEAAKAEPRWSPPYADQAARGLMHGMTLKERDADRRAPIVVAQVLPDSPAAAAGLQPGEAIVAIDSHAVRSLADAETRVFRSLARRDSLRLALASGRTVEIPPVAPPDRSRPVHPTQLYSAVDAGLLAWLLWAYFPFRRRDGQVIALLLTIHPITRFLLETIRVDEPAVLGTGLSIAQNLSILLFVGALALWVYLARQPRQLACLPREAENSSHRAQREHNERKLQNAK